MTGPKKEIMRRRRTPTELSGIQYGDFTVLQRTVYRSGYMWLCRCKCGQKIEMNGQAIKDGKARRTCNHKLSMTEREREVAQLVAQGLPNKEVARRLVISDRTVQSHLTHVFTRFDLSNRAELAAMMVRMEKNT